METLNKKHIEKIDSVKTLYKFLGRAFKSGFDARLGFVNAQNKYELHFIDSLSNENKWLSNNLIFHNMLLLQKHAENQNVSADENYILKCIYKTILAENITDEDYFRISTYLWNAPAHFLHRRNGGNGKNRDSVIAKNGKALVGIRKLFPALYIKNEEELKFFLEPISEKAWGFVVGEMEIDNNTEFGAEIEKDYWYIFYALRAYIVPKNTEMSTYGRKLRRELFNKQSYNQFKSISLLALLIFAQYDYYYRLMIEKSLKETIRQIENHNDSSGVILLKEDYLIEMQGMQKISHYKAYSREIEKGHDIKTFALYDGKEFNFHSDIVSEINEAALIAEGIYQILENAVKYAGGGLMSIRIYDKNEESNNRYLSGEYGHKFFCGKSENFYLEIEISDLSNESIPTRFIRNVKERAKENKEQIIAQMISESSDSLKLKDFFDFSAKKGIWESYYGNLKNRVHHYGLQIFDSIVKSRNGLFIVAGHGDYYDSMQLSEEECFYDKFDRLVSGTSYRVLLPLSHNHMEGGNIVTDMPEVDESALAEPTVFCNILEHFSFTTGQFKEEIIDEISDNLNISETSRADYVADYSEINNKKITVEVFFKAILQKIFSRYYINNNDTTQTHLAVVNLETHQLLEAIRVLALFYYKPSGCKGMGQVQIYLRGKNAGEEIVFFGERLDDILHNFVKTSLARGVVCESSKIIESILGG